MTSEEAVNLIDDIRESDYELTIWESDFISSIEEWMGNGRDLTEKQGNCLRKIHQKATEFVSELDIY